MMKKTAFLVLALFFTGAASMNAQVNIGTQTDPHKGAVLDLDVTDKGLLLPKVSLDNVTIFKLTDGGAKSNVGMVVYNTNASIIGGSGEGLYSWDGKKWRSLTASGSAMTTNPTTLPAFQKEGGSETITVTSPDAEGVSGSYTYTIISGGNYATVDPQSSENGQFTLDVDPNASAAGRKVVVMVTDPAGNQTTLVFNQDGDTSGCTASGNPTIATTGNTLCAGGAVYLSVSNPESINYYWTLGSNVVSENNYLMATQAGTYTVYAGSVGCSSKASVTITNSSTTAASAVSTVISENGGIVCGTSGSVKLTAMGSPANVVWFKNGVKTTKTGAVISLGASDAGEWVAVVANGTCYSKPSNVVTVAYNSSSSGQVALNANDVLVNGTPIANVTSFCPGGSLVLTVSNQQSGITYKWYNGDQEINSPYTIPSSQTSMLLRLVASDNTNQLCPAEANSAEKTIAGSTPSTPVISGATGVCSGSTTQLAATEVSGATYEWYKDGVLQSGVTTNAINAAPGNYTVRYTNASGCSSIMSTVKTVATQGAPAIDWNEFLTEVRQGNSYTFSVRSTGTTAPTAYTWSASPVGSATITGTGNSVSVSFSANSTISVQPSNNCGPGSVITKSVSVITDNLPAVTITPTSGTYCNSVSFKIARPASGWSDAEWASLGSSNVTATYNGSAYAGTLSSDGTNYYYSVVATSAASLPATITVSGSIGSKPITAASATANIQTSTESSFAVVGTNCFDIAYQVDGGSCGLLTQRTSNKANFNQTYTYKLSGTLGSGTIQSVVWSYTNPKGAVVQFTAAGTSTTLANNQVTVKFDPALSTTALGEAGIEVVITAIVTISGGSCGNAIYTVAQPVKIKDCMCGCPVKISSTGYITLKCHNLGADETADWRTPSQALNGNYYQWGRTAAVATVSTSASAISGWNSNYSSIGGPNWTNVQADPCTSTYGSGWRLPTNNEWQLIYNNNTFTNVGSWSNSATNFSSGKTLTPSGSSTVAAYLPAAGYRNSSDGSLTNRGNSGYYWAGTQNSTTNGYNLAFGSGGVGPQNGDVKSYGFSVRCVSE